MFYLTFLLCIAAINCNSNYERSTRLMYCNDPEKEDGDPCSRAYKFEVAKNNTYSCNFKVCN